jgi:hypothetical protein
MAVKYDVILGKLREDDSGGGGGGTPGGSNGQVQYNNSGAFGATTLSFDSSQSPNTYLEGSPVNPDVNGADVHLSGGDGGTTTGAIVTANIASYGLGYLVNDVLTVVGGNSDATVRVDTVGIGELYSVTIAAAGTGYTALDVLTVSGGNGDSTFRVDTVGGGGEVLTRTQLTQGTGYTGGYNPGVATTGGTGTGCTVDTNGSSVGAITALTLTAAGTGYTAGSNIYTLSGGAGTGGEIQGIVLVGTTGGDVVLQAGAAQGAEVDGLVKLIGATQHTYSRVSTLADDSQYLVGITSNETIEVNAPRNIQSFSGSTTSVSASGSGAINQLVGQRVSFSSTADNSSNNNIGQKFQVYSTASSPNNSLKGQELELYVAHSSGSMNAFYGLDFSMLMNGAGSISNMALLNGGLTNVGTITTVNLINPTLTNTGTIDTLTGYYLGTIVGGTNTNKPYNIWLTDADARNVMNGKTGLGVNDPTARLHLQASDGTAGTAPIKLTSGTVLATPEAGTIEFDGTNIYLTV